MIQFDLPLPPPTDPSCHQQLKQQIETFSHHTLPLQQGLAHTSAVSDEPFSAMILHIEETPATLQVKCGIFYAGIIGGCNCSDDPTPVNTQTEHCELLFDINRNNGHATVTLL